MTDFEEQSLKEYIKQRMDGFEQRVKEENQEHKASMIKWVVSLFIGSSLLVVSVISVIVTAAMAAGI